MAALCANIELLGAPSHQGDGARHVVCGEEPAGSIRLPASQPIGRGTTSGPRRARSDRPFSRPLEVVGERLRRAVWIDLTGKHPAGKILGVPEPVPYKVQRHSFQFALDALHTPLVEITGPV